MRRAILVSIVAAACTPPQAPPSATPDTTQAPTSTASATASAAPIAEPPRPPAKIGAPLDGRFAQVAECPGGAFMGVELHPVGKGHVGTCGYGLANTAVFCLPES